MRFDWDKSLLKVYSGSSHQWLPVCSDSWNDSYSQKTCQQLGFERYTFPTSPRFRDVSDFSHGHLRLIEGHSYQEDSWGPGLRSRAHSALKLFKGTVAWGAQVWGQAVYRRPK